MPRRNAVLVDTGPLVASFNEADRWHTVCVKMLSSMHDPLMTTWPTITEAMYLLDASVKAQDGLWDFLLSGALIVLPVDIEDIARMRELMHQYHNRHIDLADAALVRVAEREHITTIFTIDQQDFRIYQPRHTRHFHLLPDL